MPETTWRLLYDFCNQYCPNKNLNHYKPTHFLGQFSNHRYRLEFTQYLLISVLYLAGLVNFECLGGLQLFCIL